MAIRNPQKDKNVLSSLNHALKVLDLISAREELGVSEIARLTGYDKSSVFKMLYTFEHRDYVIKTPDARYRLSGKLSSGGDPSSGRKNITEIAAPAMRRLRDICNESVYLGVLNTNGRVIFLHKEDGWSADSVRVRIGYEIEAYTNASGKLLLANLDGAMQANILGIMQLRAHAPKTITSRQRLIEELTAIRGAPWAETSDENYPGHGDIAAPIFDASCRCVAALSIVCASEKLRQIKAGFLSLLSQTAETISRDMGYQKNEHLGAW